MRHSRSLLVLGLFTALVGALASAGASEETPYQTPSPSLVDIVDAPRTPAVSLSPRHDWLLLMEIPSLPSIAELAEPELRLAGLRINPRNFGPSRTRPFSGLMLQRLDGSSPRSIRGLPEATPEEPVRIGNVTWSPDGRFVAFTLTRSDVIEPWLLEVGTAIAGRIAEVQLNLAAFNAPVWLPDSSGLIASLVPDDVGEAPEPPRVPAGPIVQETSGTTAPARTYQDLLASPHDEALFEHYFTAQLAKLGLDGSVDRLGEPGLYWDFSPSPSGSRILITELHGPLSYRVPAYRFGHRIAVWNRRGEQVFELADVPLQEGVPMAFGSVPTGPRSAQWRADAPATLAWVEALDGGDARNDVAERDRLFTLEAPFTGDPVPLATLDLRYAGIFWGSDDLAIVNSRWWKNRRAKVWSVAPGDPAESAKLLFDRSYEDRYSDPGTPETITNAAGRRVLHTSEDGSSIFLIGAGASPEGDRPFLDRYDLATGETERLFRSEAPYYELPVQMLPGESQLRVLTRRESRTEPPNYLVRVLGSDATRALTRFEDPTPQLRGLSKELIKYQRADGVGLTATLYLPPGYEPSRGPLPMLMWAYPREYKSAAAAGQVRESPYRFDRINHWSPQLWLAAGYAVLDDPAMPIVGEGDTEPNDTYVEQLVASAKAAVDEVVRRGVTAPGMIAIGGHSYGAFMAANLLAHSDLYAAGIARSGAYNRTLTPFGFQAEERSFWEAPEVYFAMSPFMHADKVNEPILLIHGQLDNNSGTFPIQSERFYAALKGHGATARLVMLPYESHGYRARESLLHMLWEQEQWLGRWLKRPAEGTSSAAPDR